MTASWLGAIALTAFSLALLAWTISRHKLPGVSWRVAFAEAPVPMMGIASSYGVYAYNLIFMPWWAAVVVAAAYESVYIGIPQLDNLTPTQIVLAGNLANAAGWVSFAQNALAGMDYAFHLYTGLHLVKMLFDNPMWLSIPALALLASLHAAQVWVNYHYVKLVHQRHRRVDTAPGKVSGVKVSTLSPRPTHMRRSFPQLPPPVAVNLGNVARKPGKTITTRGYDAATVDTWIAMSDQGMGYRTISETIGGKPSHTIIGQQIAKRRAELESPVAGMED